MQQFINSVAAIAHFQMALMTGRFNPAGYSNFCEENSLREWMTSIFRGIGEVVRSNLVSGTEGSLSLASFYLHTSEVEPILSAVLPW